MATSNITSADVKTVLSNTDRDNPNDEKKSRVIYPIFDYSKVRDVEYYVEFTSFAYERGLNGQQTGRKKELVVRLPLLSSITHTYSMNYTTADMALFYDALISGAQAGGAAYKGDVAGAMQKLGMAAKQAGGALEQTGFNALSVGGEYTGILSNQLGISKNPRQEATFVGIGMRNHSMGFNLVPRNKEENIIINGIIQAFKTRMHPEIAKSQGIDVDAFLGFPDEFVINFWSKDGKKLAPGIPDCFLAMFSVIYNANGQARFFDDGMATSYRIDLGFVESNQLTRRDIEVGGY